MSESTHVREFTFHCDGLTVTRSYTSHENLLAAISNAAVGNYSYTWDANHNKLTETITGAMSGYGFTVPTGGYDDDDRLVEWNRDDSGLDQIWDLSPVGDWDEFTQNTVVQTRVHGLTHELLEIDSVPLDYDPRGNLTTNANGQTYAWDADGMLKTATVPNGCPDGIEGTHEYEYDALGRRVAKTIDDVPHSTTITTVYVHSGAIVLAEYDAGDAAASPQRKYVNASYVDEPVLLVNVSAGPTETLFYYHRDQQYSITALTNAAGIVVERYAYTPYGVQAILDATGTTPRAMSLYGNPYLYTARAWDLETGLFYFRARIYSAPLGRFVSRDPAGYLDGPNQYWSRMVTGGVDPGGLLLISVDGTNSKDWLNDPQALLPNGRWQSHCRNFYEDYQGARAYWHGPNWTATGWDCPGIENGVMEYLQSAWCADTDQPIDIVGHSRGGYIAMQVARRIKEEGIHCDNGCVFHPPVRFLGLYDPVDMAPGYGGDGIPGNVLDCSVIFPDTQPISIPWSPGRSVPKYPQSRPPGVAQASIWRFHQLRGAIFTVYPGHSCGHRGAPWTGDHPGGGHSAYNDTKFSIECDRKIRCDAIKAGVPIGSVSDYGYPIPVPQLQSQ